MPVDERSVLRGKQAMRRLLMWKVTVLMQS